MSHGNREQPVAPGEVARPTAPTAQRSVASGVTLATTAGLLLSGLAIPTISAAMGITFAQGVLIVSVVFGVVGLAFVYLVVARLSSERDAALRREAELRHELAHRLIARERERISRDLHDDVATELTALVWKVREIADVAPCGPSHVDMAAVADRLRSVIANLRNVVLALRKPQLSFPELQLLVEQRCRELCGHANLRLKMHGRVEVEELTVFHDHILPICFELVSNAALHAKASQIELELRIGSRLQILVSDDGCGLAPELWQGSDGGLRGVRQRVQQLGGGVTFETAALGTRFVVDLPRPLRSVFTSDEGCCR